MITVHTLKVSGILVEYTQENNRYVACVHVCFPAVLVLITFNTKHLRTLYNPPLGVTKARVLSRNLLGTSKYWVRLC